MDEILKEKIGRREKVNLVVGIGKGTIRSLIEEIAEMSDEIFVVRNEDVFDKVFENIAEHCYTRVFLEDELILCPIDNEMVPKHEIASLDEVKELLALCGKKKLPRILFKDPIVRWNGWKCNSIIKITRKNGEIYYRHLYCSDIDCSF